MTPFVLHRSAAKRAQTQQSCHDTSPKADIQAQKKDIATYLSANAHPNFNTSLTLSDAVGKTITLKCNTNNPTALLDIAMAYLSD
ncbi:hypothetical protein [Psychrobacter pygoscelis]|uniref:hypothetical protein n=1 Tax=Psychrobacter pygoscelis TaxID=2488563 RepID=UPI00103D1BD1|nr:hypothetical protein [Psychrobacter pygoscelis]